MEYGWTPVIGNRITLDLYGGMRQAADELRIIGQPLTYLNGALAPGAWTNAIVGAPDEDAIIGASAQWTVANTNNRVRLLSLIVQVTPPGLELVDD